MVDKGSGSVNASEAKARPVDRLLILGAALLFSTGGAAIKACTLSSWQVAGLRCGLAALALMVAVPAWRRFWTPRSLLVGCAYAATMILFVVGNKLTTAANTIFLQSTAPLYVMLLAPRLLGEKLELRDLVSFAALFAGLVLFLGGSEAPQATAPSPDAGNLMGAASGVTWAFTLLGLRWLGREAAPEVARVPAAPAPGASAGTAVVAGNWIALGVCLPFVFPVQDASGLDWTLVLYLGLFQIGLAYVFMTRGVARVRALEASLLLLLEPVLNALWAWLIHGERVGPWSLAGAALILAATILRALRQRS